MAKETEQTLDTPLILTLMDKSVRQFMLYGRNHPQFQSALSDFFARLKDFFVQRSALDLTVKRSELEWEGKKIFEITKREGNYLQQMYVDGVRRLEFLSQIQPQELEDFISVLGRDLQSYESQEDDTVTLLWKKNLPHLKTETIDIYASDRLALLQQDDLSDDNLTEAEKQEQDYLDSLIYRLLGYESELEAESEFRNSTKEHKSFVDEIKSPAAEEYFHLSEDDLRGLNQEIAQLGKRDFYSEIVIIFNEVLETEKDSRNFPLLVRVYTDAIINFLDNGDLARASAWLKYLRAAQMKIGQTHMESHQLIEEEIIRMATGERFAKLGDEVAKGTNAVTKEWVTFFSYLGGKAAPAICEFLMHVPQEPIHEAVRLFLLEQAPDQTEVYLQYLKKAQWQIVRDMVRILSSLLDQNVLTTVFKHVAIHPAPDVRTEVIRNVSRFRNEFSFNLLRRGIADSSDAVRALCLGILVRDPVPMLAKSLAALVTQLKFLDTSANEKRATLLALARCGGAESLSFLHEIVDDSGTTPAHDELRMAALQAIADIQDPKAEEILQMWAKKSFFQKSLRDAAKRLLERRTPIPQPEEEQET